MKLVLHAPNVHRGGGATLLVALIQTSLPGVQRVVIIDERLPIPETIPSGVVIHRIAPHVTSRLQADWRLRTLVEPGDALLCFGNLPPLFRVRGTSVLFIQNRHLVEPTPRGFSWKAKLRLFGEKLWQRWKLKNVQRVVVQTPTMQRMVEDSLRVSADVLPFFSAGPSAAMALLPGEVPYDFIYVSSGEPHKNHATLLDAWDLLAIQDIRPALCLTLSEEADVALCRRIAALRGEHGVQIAIIGAVPLQHLQKIYSTAKALIFPSFGESFGLPLLEAAAANLPIIAPEADYVRDVVDPVETFDPGSAVSIARAVKRFLGVAERKIIPTSPENFLLNISGRGAVAEKTSGAAPGSSQETMSRTAGLP